MPVGKGAAILAPASAQRRTAWISVQTDSEGSSRLAPEGTLPCVWGYKVGNFTGFLVRLDLCSTPLSVHGLVFSVILEMYLVQLNPLAMFDRSVRLCCGFGRPAFLATANAHRSVQEQVLRGFDSPWPPLPPGL
jgi:hypothetical protein